MQSKVGFTESARYICLEGLNDTIRLGYLCTINLAYCGREQCSNGFQFGPHVRAFYVIHLILNGKGIYHTQYGTYLLQKGDAFIIYPGEDTYYRADEEDPWEYTWVGFQGMSSEELILSMGFTRTNPVVQVRQSEEIKQCIVNMLQAKQLTVVNEIKRVSELLKVISLFIEDEHRSKEHQNQEDYPSDIYVNAAIDYMQIHLSDKIKIDDLADHIGITRSYLTDKFKKKTGMPPQEFLIRLRMSKAATLLWQTKDPISQIAAECGYEDSLNFLKVFKQKYQVSPKSYRESEVTFNEFPDKFDHDINYPL